MIQNSNGTSEFYYTYADNLGSLTALTNENGTVVERYAYSPWGQRLNPYDWREPLETWNADLKLTRGYTGHEHLDFWSIINMNGRLYDPVTAQFFSPDPFIQSPYFWLNYNRYAYAFGNPFKYVDPDGEIIWFVPILVGVGVYMLVEYGSQVVANIIENQTNPTLKYTTADILWNKIDWFDIAVSGVEGGLSVAFPAAAPYLKYASPLVKNAVDLNFDSQYNRIVGKDFGVGEYLIKTGLDVGTTAMTDLVKWGTTKPNPYSFDKSKPFQTKSLFERYDKVSFKDFWQKTLKDMPWDFGASFLGNSAKQGWQNQYDDYLQRQNKPSIPPYVPYKPELPYYYHKNTKPNDKFDNNMQSEIKLSKSLQLNLSK